MLFFRQLTVELFRVAVDFVNSVLCYVLFFDVIVLFLAIW